MTLYISYKRFSARKMVSLKPAEIADNFKGRFILVFDDGEILTTARETIYSSFFWEFHNQVPNMPMLKSHHLRSYLGAFQKDDLEWKTQKYYNSRMHNDIGKAVYWSAHLVRNTDKPHRFDKFLNKLYFKTINNVYNFLASLEGYELSFNDTEYLAIRFHPFVDAAQKRLTPNPKVINEVTKEVIDFIKTSPDFDNNSLAKSVRAGLVREMQLMQCLLVRGYIEDNDGDIFEEPILNGFIDGLSQVENLIESRAASKSLLYNKKVIQFVEYFSRTIQLQAMAVKNLHKGDCGSTSFYRWPVRPALLDPSNGRTVRDGDLKNLQGKFYKLNYEDTQIQELLPTDTHLIGKTILVRSAIAGCRHPDPHGICSVCFGALSASFDEHNLGQQSAAALAAGQTQAVLSQKHAQASSISEPIVIDDNNKNFFTTNVEKDSFFFNERLIGKNFSIVLSKDECLGIFDLPYVDSVEEIGSITHASELTSVTFVILSNDGMEDEYTIPVSLGVRRSSLSLEMLHYIKNNKPVIKNESYVIDMSKWNSKAPFSILPQSQESPYIRASKIRSLVLGDSKNSEDRDTSEAPISLLQKVFDLVNASLNVNIALLEVVVYSLMVKNTTTRDYFFPKEGDRIGLGINSRIMARRSLGGPMALEDHAAVIMDTTSYDATPRLDHTYDVLLCPQEHLMNYDREVFLSNK